MQRGSCHKLNIQNKVLYAKHLSNSGWYLQSYPQAYIVIQPKIFKTFIHKIHLRQCYISSLSGLPLNFEITPAHNIVLAALNMVNIIP